MGKLTDKFLDFMRLTDDDYEDEYEEEYDIDDEPAAVSKKKPLKSTRVRESLDDLDDDVSYSEPAKPVKTRGQRNSKVVPMRGKNGLEVCVVKPTTVEDARDVTDTLVGGRAVILNLEGLHVELAQRIIDFTAGSCYAIDGNLQKVSSYIFIITPKSVEITGDFQEMLDGDRNIDIASM